MDPLAHACEDALKEYHETLTTAVYRDAYTHRPPSLQVELALAKAANLARVVRLLLDHDKLREAVVAAARRERDRSRWDYYDGGGSDPDLADSAALDEALQRLHSPSERKD